MQRETILLVDDDAAVRNFARILLERAGYKVHTAGDGEEGLRIFQDHRTTIQLLITDLRMPNMNGLDLASRVLQTESRLPVLFMTGDGPTAVKGYDHVAKPVKPAELIRRVDEVLSESNGGQRREASAVVGAGC